MWEFNKCLLMIKLNKQKGKDLYRPQGSEFTNLTVSKFNSKKASSDTHGYLPLLVTLPSLAALELGHAQLWGLMGQSYLLWPWQFRVKRGGHH